MNAKAVEAIRQINEKIATTLHELEDGQATEKDEGDGE